jgi:hypothetical protein
LASPTTAVVLAGLTVALAAAVVVLASLTHDRQDNLESNLPLILFAVAFSVVGFVVARRQPQNPAGWILMVVGGCILLTLFGWAYSVIYYRLHQGALPVALVALAAAYLAYAGILLVPLLLLLFPSGRVPSRLWGWAMWVYLIAAGAGIITNMVVGAITGTGHHVNIAPQGFLQSSVQLTGFAATFARVASSGALSLLYPVFYVACIVRLAASYRHTTGDSRQQLKWLAGGAFLTLVGLLVDNGAPSGGYSGPAGELVTVVAGLAACALPVGLGVGILKYRLYDVDRLISRTLSYAIVTGLLVGVYVGLVTLATRVLPFSSPLGVAASTLVAVALFNPLRRRVQRLVDRRFNRARYDAEATVAAFAHRVRDDVELEAVSSEFIRAVQRSVEPAHVSLWLRPTGSSS